MTTVRQLARILNVSPSSISRALTGAPGVSAQLRERIISLAKEYQYRPNRLTQRLFSGKSGILGFIANEIHVEYTGFVFEGACEEALQDGFFVLPMNTHGSPEEVQVILHKLIEIKVEGIILANYWDSPLTTEQLLDLRGRDIPVVGLNWLASEIPIDRVLIDEHQLADVAITRLWELGHREVAICGVWTPRRALYHRSQCLQQTVSRLMGSSVRQIDAEMQESMQAFFESPRRETAVIGCSDGIAAKLMRFAHDARTVIPQDLSVLGCGNSSFCEKCIPPLSSIDEAPLDIGRAACRLLKQRITTPLGKNESPSTRTVPVRMIERESYTHPKLHHTR